MMTSQSVPSELQHVYAQNLKRIKPFRVDKGKGLSIDPRTADLTAQRQALSRMR